MKTKTIQIALLALLAVSMTSAATAQATTNLDVVLVKTDPIPLQSGEDGKVYLKIRNTGSDIAEDVNITIQDSFPFEVRPDTPRSFLTGDIRPGEEYFIVPELLINDQSPDGNNNLKVKIETQQLTSTRNIPIQVESEEVELDLASISTQPDSLRPDTDDNKLLIEIANNGERDAENVVLNLDLPAVFEPTSSLSTRKSLGTMNAGQVKNVEFTFDIRENATKGALNIPGQISYRTTTDSDLIEAPVSFDMYISGAPKYEITDISSDLRAGASGKIEVTVKNTGSEKSSSTRLRVLDSSEVPLSYDSSNVFIGTLEPGQEGTAIIDVTVDSDADAKDYFIDFEVRGVKDTEVFVDDKSMKINVAESEQGGSVLIPVLIGILFVLAIIGFVFRDRIKAVFKRSGDEE